MTERVPGKKQVFTLARQCSHLVLGHGLRVRFSLGANVNTPFFEKPTLLRIRLRFPVCTQFLLFWGSPLLCTRC